MVCLDGALVRPEDAVISVFDRGFLYGDSVYEVLRTYRGVPYLLEPHLERLSESARRIGMGAMPIRELSEETLATHRAAGNADSYLRLIVTRGGGKIGLDPALAEGSRRIVIAQDVEEMRPPARLYDDGCEVSLVDVRRNLRAAVDPAAKTGNYLNSVMALAEARKKGAYEAIMLDHRDMITEGASSNIFVVVGGVLLTPAPDVGILKGVTRGVVLSLAGEAKIRVLEVPLTPSVLTESADEAFLTSSIREIVPVTKVDGRPVGSGRVGPVTQRLRGLFLTHVERTCTGQAAVPAR
jgi:branched-chain amino acid aminotransferase